MADDTGPRIQLLAKGPQDVYLSSPVGHSYWRTRFPRPTRFALQVTEETFPHGFLFGKRNTTTIPLSGDCLGTISLEIRLPAIPGASPQDTWVPKIGYVLLRRIKVWLNETLISDQERLWYDIHTKLFVKTQHEDDALGDLIGTNPLSLTTPHTLIVPLKLPWSLTHFFPLIAMPGVSMSMEIEAESFAHCIVSAAPLAFPTRNDELDVRCLFEYAFLDREERYSLIRDRILWHFDTAVDMETKTYKETLSTDGTISRVSLPQLKVDLSELNVPVRALVVVVYAENYGKHYFSYDPYALESAQVYANNNELITRLPAPYFQLMTRVSRGLQAKGLDGIHYIPFCMNANALQPSGSLGLDRARQPYVDVTFTQQFQDTAPRAVVKVFALVRRVLQLYKGNAAFLTL